MGKYTAAGLGFKLALVASFPAVRSWLGAGRSLALVTWSPGDGWTRYRVAVRDDATGGEDYLLGCSAAMTAAECGHYLDGMTAALEMRAPSL